MSEAIKIPQSIHFHPEDHDPGETILLLAGEPGAHAVVGAVHNFDDFPCLEEEQAEECHKAATAIADKIVLSYNAYYALCEALREVIANHDAWEGVRQANREARGDTAVRPDPKHILMARAALAKAEGGQS